MGKPQTTPLSRMDKQSLRLVADLKAKDEALDAKLRREGLYAVGNPPPFADEIQRQTAPKKGK